MRLHTLTVQAFGPFGGTETVDFDALSEAGLFLIQGPTGAGKTSVLDAVCFALYGRVPGDREGAKSPRSFHAPPDRLPEVRCELSVRGRRLSIVRSPAWERPKQRGTGTTRANHKVVVTERVDGAWRPVTTRPDEAGQFLGDLLGLSLGQFCQIVLLPQGEFAQFLRATAAERRTTLERIFATGVFTEVESWLTENSRALGRAAAESEQHVLDTARIIAEHGRSEAPAGAADRPGSAADLDLLAPWAAELTAVTTAAAADLTVLAEQAEDRHGRARDRLEQARATAERRLRRSRAGERAAELEQRAGQRRAIDTELDAAVRAAAVVPLLRTVGYRRDRAEKARLTAHEHWALAAALAGYDPASPPGTDPDSAVRTALTGAGRRRRDETATLEHRRGDADHLRTVRAEITTLTGEIDLRTRQCETAHGAVAHLPARRAEITALLADASALTGPREAALESLELARQRLESAVAAERLRADLAESRKRCARAVDTAQDARDALHLLRERRIDGMAAELAAKLAADHACPVCGSAEHPAPAAGAPDRPASEDEQAALLASETAQQRRGDAEQEVASLTERRTAAEKAAAGLDDAAARALVAERTAALDRLDTAARQVEAHTEELAGVDSELESARRDESRLATELTERTERRLAREHEAERLAAGLDTARGDDPDLESRIQRLRTEADLLDSAADALHRLSIATEELRDAEAEAGRSRAEAGFADDHAAWAAERDDPARRDLTQRAKDHDDELAAVHATLADPELRTAAEGPAPDLPALESVLAGAAAEANDSQRRRDRFAERAGRLAELRTELDRALHASGPARRRHATASGLAALAAGTSADNREKARLSAYVLAARLEQVVHAANHRLATMSSGRYTLRHTIDRSAGDRSHSGGGLGLRVLDSWTGQERDPATLSGGETFFTSLALALGLGDVAAQEAGGTDIGTLFVDEGFGTLDEETLDEVMEILDSLREGGRAVGVVSHVADLRTRITTQLKAVKAPTGSRLEQVG